jgi:tetratricopeptide (TPR) repeat protein
MVFGGEDAESYYDEGVTAAMKGELERAVQCFERTIHMDNTMGAAYHQLGKCWYRQGHYGRAAKMLEQVVTKKPKMTAARLDYGFALLYAGEIQKALNQFNDILAQDPTNGRGLLGLAQTFFHEGEWQKAMSHAQNALNQGGANFSVLYLLGRAARLVGDASKSDEMLERAGKLIQKSIDMNPDNPEGYYLQGEVLFARERFADALESHRGAESRADATKAYTAFGENFARVDMLTKQGLCYQRLGRNEQARDLGELVLKIDPKHKLGQALAKLKA